MPGRLSDIFPTRRCAYDIDDFVRVTPFYCSLGRPRPPHNFGLELRRSVGELGGFNNGVHGNFISWTVTVTGSMTSSICSAWMPHIPIWFTRTVAPTVPELGAPKVFGPVRCFLEEKKSKVRIEYFYFKISSGSPWHTFRQKLVNKDILKGGDLGHFLFSTKTSLWSNIWHIPCIWGLWKVSPDLRMTW
jgi:hypothetical protein